MVDPYTVLLAVGAPVALGAVFFYMAKATAYFVGWLDTRLHDD
jgi:hypothetical protein